MSQMTFCEVLDKIVGSEAIAFRKSWKGRFYIKYDKALHDFYILQFSGVQKAEVFHLNNELDALMSNDWLVQYPGDRGEKSHE